MHSSPYRAGLKLRKLEREEIYKMQEDSMAKPVVTEWTSPVVFVSKKYGSLHFCVD